MKTSLMTILLVCSVSAQSANADIVFNVEPRALVGGYEIAGGTIRTDMAATTITAWNVEVTGPVPYTFSSATSPGAALKLGFVLSPTQITFNSGVLGLDAGFVASDNTDPDCSRCMQLLE